MLFVRLRNGLHSNSGWDGSNKLGNSTVAVTVVTDTPQQQQSSRAENAIIRSPIFLGGGGVYKLRYISSYSYIQTAKKSSVRRGNSAVRVGGQNQNEKTRIRQKYPKVLLVRMLYGGRVDSAHSTKVKH